MVAPAVKEERGGGEEREEGIRIARGEIVHTVASSFIGGKWQKCTKCFAAIVLVKHLS